MMDEAEYGEVEALFRQGFHCQSNSIKERFAPVLKRYLEMTGFEETNHNAVMHH